ncbi:MAG: thioredoxin family protein [Gemmatimonadales bacterium]
MTDFEALWHQAQPYAAFVAASEKHCGLWEGIYRIVRLPEWVYRAVPPGTRRRLLVIAEDWCGDASSTIPILGRLADAVPGMELRVLRRDEHPALMDRYLTNGSRSIPIVIVLDESFRELGHWGPRPAVLQAWVTENRPLVPKAELYPRIRTWYARDRGETTLREVLAIAAGQRGREAAGQ